MNFVAFLIFFHLLSKVKYCRGVSVFVLTMPHSLIMIQQFTVQKAQRKLRFTLFIYLLLISPFSLVLLYICINS